MRRGPNRPEPRGSRLDAWGAELDATRIEHVLLVFLCFAAVIPLLYAARSLDGNALTSWRWTFSGERMLRVLLALAPALLAAYAVARAPLRGRALPLLVACGAGAAVLPLWAEPEVVLDASRYFVQARFFADHGAAHFLREWGLGIDAWTDLPLVPFLYGAAFSVAGPSRVAAQLLDTALFAATAALTFDLGRVLWGEDAGFEAAAMLVGIPFLLLQVPLLLVDVPAMFFLTLSARAFLGSARLGGALRMATAALAAAAAALAKYSLWPVLPVVAAACAFGAGGAAPQRALARSAAAFGLAFLAVAGIVASRPAVFGGQAQILATFQWTALGRWQEGFFSTFLFQTHPFVTAFALLGALRAVAAKDLRYLLAGGALLLALPVGSARARYAIPLLPLVALGASYGLAAVRDSASRRLISLSVAASSLVVAYGAYLPFIKSTSFENLARAGAHLDALGDRVVEVRALPQAASSGSTFAAIPLLAYATRKKLVSPEEWPLSGEEASEASSPLRFSWQMRRPPFLAGPSARPGGAVVVISSEPPGERPPPALRELARFAAASDVFRYQTIVTLYMRDQGI